MAIDPDELDALNSGENGHEAEWDEEPTELDEPTPLIEAVEIER